MSSPAPATDTTRPWLTYGILLVLAGVYACELVFGVNPPVWGSPSIQTLVALGGLNKTVMLSTHEWYRFFTGPFLHASPMHLLFNGVALYFSGIVLEKLVGRLWYFALYACGAFGGAAVSCIANPSDLTSVGASGAIMALFAALFTSSFRLPHGPRRTRIQVESMRILVPSLLPLASTIGEHIDIGAHLGGAITGAAMAFVLLKLWPRDQTEPPGQTFAGAIAIIAVGIFLASGASVADHYHTYTRNLALLIPDAELPKDPAAIKLQAADLLRRYPEDPRAHIFRAQAFIGEHDLINARFELEKALTKTDNYRFMYGQRLANTIRVMLAGIWIDNGAPVEAKKAAEPVCKAAPMDRPSSKLYDLLAKYHLCEGK